MIDWENYRREDKSIDLVAVWEDHGKCALNAPQARAALVDVQELCPIRSRQAAAIAVAFAAKLAVIERAGGFGAPPVTTTLRDAINLRLDPP